MRYRALLTALFVSVPPLMGGCVVATTGNGGGGGSLLFLLFPLAFFFVMFKSFRRRSLGRDVSSGVYGLRALSL